MNSPQTPTPEEIEAQRHRLQKIVDEAPPTLDDGRCNRVWGYLQQQARAQLARLERGEWPLDTPPTG